jgi:hypothetical protein
VAGTPTDSPAIEILDNQTKADAMTNGVETNGKRSLLVCIDFNGVASCDISLVREIAGATYFDKDYMNISIAAADTDDGTEMRTIPISGADKVGVQFEAVAGAPLAPGNGINVLLRLI